MNNNIIFSAFFIIQYIWDRLTSKCDSVRGEYLLILHHIISTYIYLGGILYNPFYHLIFIFIVILHWITNNNRCELTVITNKYCKYNEMRPFNDLLFIISNQFNIQNLHWYLLPLIILYDIHHIHVIDK